MSQTIQAFCQRKFHKVPETILEIRIDCRVENVVVAFSCQQVCVGHIVLQSYLESMFTLSLGHRAGEGRDLCRSGMNGNRRIRVHRELRGSGVGNLKLERREDTFPSWHS